MIDTIQYIHRNIAMSMGITKTNIYTEQHNALANYLKALAHPARIAILNYLFELNACVCGDLVEEIGLAQPTISQHLKELKKAGLIQGNVEGRSVCYCIHQENWVKMKGMLQEFLNKNSPHPQCC